MNTAPEVTLIIPALIAGLLVLATHVPLGIEVLKRGIIFIDLALAQIASLGALIAVILAENNEYSLLSVQVCSFVFAIIGAVFFTYTEKLLPHLQEAIIGALFVFTASFSLLILSQDPNGGDHMKEMLAGQILFVSNQQLIIAAVIYTILLLFWLTRKVSLSRTSFYIIFALAVTVSVQLVGVYLVFASLIFPAIASANSLRNKLITSYISGGVGITLGILLSLYFDFATGPAMVCSMFLVAFFVVTANLLKNPIK